MATQFQVTFDANDPSRLADFWSEALGYVRQPPPDGFATWAEFADQIGIPAEKWADFDGLIDPEEVGPRLFFQRVPENKTAKNRVHLDVNAGAEAAGQDERRSTVRERSRQLKDLGGQVLREVDEPHGWCVVMTDPEGNEFCVQ